MYFLITSALILGLGGSLHCIGMCGPLILALPFQHIEGQKKWWMVAAYFGAKAIGYGTMGVIVGLLGNGIKIILWQQGLSVFSGTIILIIILLPILKNKIKFKPPFTKIINQYYSKVLEYKSGNQYLILGFLNAFLPCGLVYTALIVGSSFASASNGFIFMFLFGIGTSPLLIATIFLNYKLNTNYRKYFKYSTQVFSFMLGVILILRGLNLGIPYISPSFTEKGKVENCCKH